MELSSDSQKVNGENEGDICQQIREVVEVSDSSVVPIVDIIEGSSVFEVTCSSENSKYGDELDDLLEEQMILNKIKKVQNFRQSLSIYRDPELDKINHHIIPRLKGKNDVTASTFSDEDSDDSEDDDLIRDDDSLLDSFMATDTKQFLEKYSLEEKLKKISKALTLNILMQSQITTLELYLRNRLNENKKEQIDAKADISKLKQQEAKSNPKKKERLPCWLTSFGRPYFTDRQKFICPKNADYKKMMSNNQIISINLFPSQSWKVKEKLRLEEGVRKILIKESSQKFQEKEKELENKLKNDTSCGASEKKEIKRELGWIRGQIENMKKKTLEELFSSCDPDREFDWLRIAAKDVPRHTAEECRRMWHLYVKPTINKKKCTKEEENNVIKLIQRFGEQNWDIIAKQLRTSRSEFLCFVNYQRRLSKGSNTCGKWKKEEDERLLNIIEEHRVGNFIPWPKVAYYFEGRSFAQLYNRWTNSLNPNLRKGRFSKNEDNLIVSCVRKYGENFAKISKLLGYRTSSQIRERYSRKKPLVHQNIGRWSLEEDELLLTLVNKYGVSHWSDISKQFVTRTRTQIRQRYSAIKTFMSKYPDLGIKDIHRGPKAKSQFLIPISAAEVEAAAEVQENKMLSELIKDSKVKEKLRRREELVINMRKGRKRIIKRHSVDLKLIGYMKELFWNDHMKLRTHCVKPDFVKAARALTLICRFLKFSLVLSGDELDQGVKKLPSTLKKVVCEMIEDESACGSFKSNTIGSNEASVTHSSLNSSSFSRDTLHIDCLPVDPKETLISDSYYLLSEPEESVLYDDKNYNEKLKILHFMPYFLPPNLITMIGCRSMMLTKQKLINSLAHGCKKEGYFFHNDSEQMKKYNLKSFNGYFSEDELEHEDDCVVHDEPNGSQNNQVAVNDVSEPSLPRQNLKSLVPSTSSSETVTENNSSTSNTLSSCTLSFNVPSEISVTIDDNLVISSPSIYSEPMVPSPFASVSSETSSVLEIHSSNENKDEKYLKDEIICVTNNRLTKREAVNLWKERLMAIFGWPIVLANQPPVVMKSEQEEEEKENESEVELTYSEQQNSRKEEPDRSTCAENRIQSKSQDLVKCELFEGDDNGPKQVSTLTEHQTLCHTSTEDVFVENEKEPEKQTNQVTYKNQSKTGKKTTKPLKILSSETSLLDSTETLQTDETGNSATDEHLSKIERSKRQRKLNKLFRDFEVY